MEIVIDKKVDRFAISLEETTRAKIAGMTALLNQYGYMLGMPYSRRIQKDLWELRIRGTQEVRIFYTIQNDVAILLHAFLKKSQKIPKREMKTALQRLRHYIIGIDTL